MPDHTKSFPLQPLMKELDEMEKVNAKLSAAVEEVTLEHCKKNEVIFVEYLHYIILELKFFLSISRWLLHAHSKRGKKKGCE